MRIEISELKSILEKYKEKAKLISDSSKVKTTYEYFIERDFDSTIIAKDEDGNKVEVSETIDGDIVRIFRDDKGNIVDKKEEDIIQPVYIKIYVAYLKQPNFLAAAKGLDKALSGQIYECGSFLWGTCFDEENSDKECAYVDEYKLGLFPKITLMLKTQAPEIKKN